MTIFPIPRFEPYTGQKHVHCIKEGITIGYIAGIDQLEDDGIQIMGTVKLEFDTSIWVLLTPQFQQIVSGAERSGFGRFRLRKMLKVH